MATNREIAKSERKVQIREAEVRDAPQLARIQVDSFRSAYRGLLPDDFLAHFTHEEQTQDWADLIAAGGGDVLLVAETDEGEVDGYALGRAGGAPLSGYESELAAMHVRRERHRKGIGRALVAAMAERLAQQGCRNLMLWVLAGNPARGFYERLGGVPIGEQTNKLGDGDVEVHEIAYGWPDIDALRGLGGHLE